MGKQLTAADAKESLTAHVAAKGAEIATKYGSRLAWADLPRVLNDRACVRYPVEVRFDAARLQPGEFGFPEPIGGRPEAGFVMYVHPIYQDDLDCVPLLVFYQLVAVNYGEFASAEDAEVFGAAALGISQDEYYARLCDLADRVGNPTHSFASCSCDSPTKTRL